MSPTGTLAPPADERLAPLSRVTRALQRPELGALLGAVAIFVIFAGFDATPHHLWLTQTGFQSWSQQAAFFGIMAVPVVALLAVSGPATPAIAPLPNCSGFLENRFSMA